MNKPCDVLRSVCIGERPRGKAIAVIEAELSVSAAWEVQPRCRIWGRKQLGVRRWQLTRWFSQKEAGEEEIGEHLGARFFEAGPGKKQSEMEGRKDGLGRAGEERASRTGGPSKCPGQ